MSIYRDCASKQNEKMTNSRSVFMSMENWFSQYGTANKLSAPQALTFLFAASPYVHRLYLGEPFVKNRAARASRRKTCFLRDGNAGCGLLKSGRKIFQSFGRSRLGRIVDPFWLATFTEIFFISSEPPVVFRFHCLRFSETKSPARR